MPLDPQAKSFLDQVLAIGGPPLHTMPVAEARQAMEMLAGFQGEPPPVADVVNRSVPGPYGDIPVRIYTPEGSSPFPILVFYHGGGWVLGNLSTADHSCRTLANAAGCIVVSVDYRLAPEHKFPAAAEDCYAATRWVAEYAASFGGDAKRLAAAGDSAGGNLTAVVTLMARDRGGPRIIYQVLIYPVTDAPSDNISYRENRDGYLLTADAMRWFWNHYAREPVDAQNPYAAPLRAAHLKSLPPALVLTAEFDPLRDEGEAYAARLREAGVATQLSRYDGMIHGFFGLGTVLERSNIAMREVSAALRRALGAS